MTNKRVTAQIGRVFLLAFAFFAMVACAQTGGNPSPQNYNNVKLIDVRTPNEFAGGSVSGATNIPLNEIESRLNELNKADTIVVFCQSGNRSGQAMKVLQQNGFSNVINGGGWQSLKQKVEANSKP